MTGSEIRSFFRALFQSRLTEQLTMDLLNSRLDAERMRTEYQGIIADLRADKAQLTARLAAHEYKIGIVDPSKKLPAPTFGVDFHKMPPMKTKWQIEVEKNDEKNSRELAEEEAAKNKAATAA